MVCRVSGMKGCGMQGMVVRTGVACRVWWSGVWHAGYSGKKGIPYRVQWCGMRVMVARHAGYSGDEGSLVPRLSP